MLVGVQRRTPEPCAYVLASPSWVFRSADSRSATQTVDVGLPGPVGEVVAGGQGVGVLGAQDPFVDGQQGGELVAGPGRIPGLPGPVGEVGAGGQGVGVLGAQDPFADGQQGGVLVAGPGRIPGLPGPAGEVAAGGQGVGVLGAPDPFADGQQGGELVAGPGRIPGLARSSWARSVAGGQGVGVLGAQDPFADGQQGGELVAGPGRIPGLPGPAGEVGGGWSGCRGARGPGPVRGWAAGRRTGRGPRPHPRPARSRWARLWRAVRVAGCSGPYASLFVCASAISRNRSRAAV